jgi:hypothetical protein
MPYLKAQQPSVQQSIKEQMRILGRALGVSRKPKDKGGD